MTSVIVGAKRIDQLRDNLLAAQIRFSTDELAALDEVSRLPAEHQEDQAFYLKHDLSDQEICSLETWLVSIRQEVDSLIRSIEKWIEESDAFIHCVRDGGYSLPWL